MLSQKCKYAIRTVLFLALEATETSPCGGKQLAEALKIPLAFSGKILQELAKKGVITSIKGPGGGFFLSASNVGKPIIKIVDAVDGLSFFESCGLGLAKCSEESPCPIHHEFKKSREHLMQVFSTKSIGELASDIQHNDWHLVL